ncbi:PAS domain-containing protein [Candidatus Saccharibacteria bacterium]|nr:PAS domain-containing protein [Candidatus Saccharibacteria bacterium]
MKAQLKTRFWQRRLCEVMFVVSLVIVGFYLWAAFGPNGTTLGVGLMLPDISLFIAIAGALISFILYLWTPKKASSTVIYALFGLSLLLAASVILPTGGIHSPFLALWIVIGFMAGLFGTKALLTMLILSALYILYAYTLSSSPLSRDELLGVLLATNIPLLLSYLVWLHAPKSHSTRDDLSLHDLAHRLSQETGKSDIVIEAITDGVIAINPQNHIELINPAAQDLIGWNKGDALGLDYELVLKLVDAKDEPLTPVTNPVEIAKNSHKPVHSDELSLVTSSDKRRLISMTVTPMMSGGGMIIVFRDVSKEKAEERQQAEFISTASHEMRTPVAAIEGYLGLALNPATAQIDDKAREYITKAHESAEHLGRLFQDLLDVSRAEDGRLKNDPKVVDVSALVHDTFDGLRQKAADKQLRYVFKPAPDDNDTSEGRRLSPVFYSEVDQDHLREVVGNLIENAIKYTPRGEVVVDVTGDQKSVTISITDSGLGIPAEDLPHLFQKFYRVDSSDTREIGGTGLGLYLSRRLVEAMSGNIWVESIYKSGSTFFVKLPRISHEEAQQKLDAALDETTQQAGIPVISQVTSTPLSFAQPQQTPQASPQYQQPPQPYTQPQTPSQPQPSQFVQNRPAPVGFTPYVPPGAAPPTMSTQPQFQTQFQPQQQPSAPYQQPTAYSAPTLEQISANPSVYQNRQAQTPAVPPRDTRQLYNKP